MFPRPKLIKNSVAQVLIRNITSSSKRTLIEIEKKKTLAFRLRDQVPDIKSHTKYFIHLHLKCIYTLRLLFIHIYFARNFTNDCKSFKRYSCHSYITKIRYMYRLCIFFDFKFHFHISRTCFFSCITAFRFLSAPEEKNVSCCITNHFWMRNHLVFGHCICKCIIFNLPTSKQCNSVQP